MTRPFAALEAEALKLAAPERAKLAQVLLSSIAGGPVDRGQAQAVAEAKRRDAEMTLGQAAGRLHDDVMRAARRSVK